MSVGWVAGVLDDPPGFPYTPPCIDVLEGGKLTPNNVAGSLHYGVVPTKVVLPEVLNNNLGREGDNKP